MCNRYRLSADEHTLAKRYGFDSAITAPRTLPQPELFPKRPAYVVRRHEGVGVLDVMSWGFPTRVAGKRIDKTTGKPVMLDKDVTNVRNYTSPFWRSALANPERRCLVPFTAFSEYGQKRGQEGKLPLHWFEVTSQPITSFAGIWRPVEDGAVFAFLTTDPNPVVAPIHPKAMPVLLHREDEDRWLTADFDGAIGMVQPFPSQLMRVDA
ncbi:SOS response-associated peptidase [Sphingomonas sp. WKB10]|nr:SOS response-associated peptidase [Sphingomonas sp. WKB10]